MINNPFLFHVYANHLVPRVGWLTDLTNWLRDLVKTMFTEAIEFAKDFIEMAFAMFVDVVLVVIAAIPVPEFLDGLSLCSILGDAGPSVAWAVGAMRVPEGMAIIAGGFLFYLVRKVVTLFQW